MSTYLRYTPIPHARTTSDALESLHICVHTFRLAIYPSLMRYVRVFIHAYVEKNLILAAEENITRHSFGNF
jgi:hypothetical protein